MDSLEQQLQRARLLAPSPEFDRRIEALFTSARQRSSFHHRWAPQDWLTLVASAGLAAVFVLSVHLTSPSRQMTVYETEAKGHLREMLLAPAETIEMPEFEFVVTAEPVVQPRNPSTNAL